MISRYNHWGVLILTIRHCIALDFSGMRQHENVVCQIRFLHWSSWSPHAIPGAYICKSIFLRCGTRFFDVNGICTMLIRFWCLYAMKSTLSRPDTRQQLWWELVSLSAMSLSQRIKSSFVSLFAFVCNDGTLFFDVSGICTMLILFWCLYAMNSTLSRPSLPVRPSHHYVSIWTIIHHWISYCIMFRFFSLSFLKQWCCVASRP